MKTLRKGKNALSHLVVKILIILVALCAIALIIWRFVPLLIAPADTFSLSPYVNTALGFSMEIPRVSKNLVNGMSYSQSDTPVSVFIDTKSSTSSTAYVDFASNDGVPLATYIQDFIRSANTFDGPSPITIEIDRVNSEQDVIATLKQRDQGCSATQYKFDMSPAPQQGVFYVAVQSPADVPGKGEILGQSVRDNGDGDPCYNVPMAEYYPAGNKLAIFDYTLQYCPFPMSLAGENEDGNGPDCYSPLVTKSFQFTK